MEKNESHAKNITLPVNLSHTLCVIKKQRPEKTRVPASQAPEKTPIDGISRAFSRLPQG